MTSSPFAFPLAVLGCLFIAPSPVIAEPAPKPVVAVTSIIAHPSLDAVRRGLEDELEGDDVDLVFRSAAGSLAAAKEIAGAFVDAGPDVIVPISTPSAKAVTAVADDTPVVFALVRDPWAAGLVAAGRPVTGLSSHAPMAQHLDLVKTILPAAETVGVIHDPSARGSAAMLAALRAAAEAHELGLVEAPASLEEDVHEAALVLDAVDAILVPPGRTVAAAIETLIEVARSNQIPVVSADPIAVHHGAVAALAVSYDDVGRQLAGLVHRVLGGEPPASIPVEAARATKLFVNVRAASAIGIELPDALVDRADEVVTTLSVAAKKP